MCGRFVLHGPVSRLESHFDLPWSEPFADRFNIAPMSPVLIVRNKRVEGFNTSVLALVRWGLIPAWAKDSPLPSMHNARAESVAEKASFRFPFARRRCLIPASGYYEWQSSSVGGVKAKLPHYISSQSGEPLALGAVWEHWQGADGSEVESVAVLTQAARSRLQAIHERMPVLIPKALWKPWLDPAIGTKEAQELLDEVCSERRVSDQIDDLELRVVSRAVNSGAAQGPELIVPVSKLT